MSVITLPEDIVRVAERSFRLAATNLSSQGLFGGQVLTYGPVAQRWVASLEFAPMARARWQAWDGILAGLGGQTGLVRAGDPARRRPYYDSLATVGGANWDDGTGWDDGTSWSEGTLPPTVAVGAAAARGATFIQLAFPAGFESLAAVLRPGDLIEIRPGGLPAQHGHLYIATGTTGTDAAGGAGVAISPPLRAGIAAGDTAALRDPTSVFRLASDDGGEISVDSALIGRLGLALIEVLPR